MKKLHERGLWAARLLLFYSNFSNLSLKECVLLLSTYFPDYQYTFISENLEIIKNK